MLCYISQVSAYNKGLALSESPPDVCDLSKLYLYFLQTLNFTVFRSISAKMILERLRLIQILWTLVRQDIIENGTPDDT